MAVETKEFISIAIDKGCVVSECAGHYCVIMEQSVKIVVTVPNVPYLAKKLVDRLKALLGL